MKEETGLDVLSAQLIAVYTEPDAQMYYNRYGDQFELLFRFDEWSGTILTKTDETSDAQYYPLKMLPESDDEYRANHERKVVEDLKRYTGDVLLR